MFIFLIVINIFNKIENAYKDFKTKEEIIIEKSNNDLSGIKEKAVEIIEYSTKEDIWQLEIPKVNLLAPIAEGTSKEVMQEFVGHFENTSRWKGNVGLAAHNRGYPINYFSKLKDLKNGDKIIYKTKFGTKIYVICLVKIIEDTNWSYLQNTKDNKITLITCVANKPNKRLCIQAIEMKEE